MKYAKSANEAMQVIVGDILKSGRPVAPRGMATHELTSYAISIANPRDRFVTLRPIREGYCAAKVVWDLDERDDVETLLFWNPHGRKFADDGEVVQGENYGQRWTKFLEEGIEILKLDPNSRRVWIPIWKPYDMINDPACYDSEPNNHIHEFPSRESSNVPCTLGFSLRILRERLVMQVVMRSNAVIGVLPYDIFGFTVIQELVANELGVRLGAYEHVMLSAHIYEYELEAAKGLMLKNVGERDAMEKIELTYTEAKAKWPGVMDAIMKGEQVRAEDDPIMAMMRRGSPVVGMA